MDIVSYGWGEYPKKSMEEGRNRGAVILGWTGDNGDPDNFLSVLLSCAAAPGSANHRLLVQQEFSDIIAKAKATSNHDERVPLYPKRRRSSSRKGALGHDRAFDPIVPMAKNVTGFVQSPLGDSTF